MVSGHPKKFAPRIHAQNRGHSSPISHFRTPKVFSRVDFDQQILGSVLGRTDFSRIFIFGPPDFFADFLAGFFLLIFVEKSAQKNPPGKSPAKSFKFYTTKIPDTFLQRGRTNKYFCLGMSHEFCRDVWEPWGCSKSLCKDVCAHFGSLLMPQSG